MRGAKIQLSPAEGSLIINADVILTKNRVMAKMKTLLEDVQEDLLLQATTLPFDKLRVNSAQDRPFSKPHVFDVPPKISRGENYLGLPYLVLDYPRIFQQQDVFAIRSFFWWGRFFSSTLQLSGSYKEDFLPKIEGTFPTFSAHHIGINPDPWQHHFEQDNYKPVAGLQHGDFKKLLYQHAHVKLATKLPVAEWEQASSYLVRNWRLFLAVLL